MPDQPAPITPEIESVSEETHRLIKGEGWKYSTALAVSAVLGVIIFVASYGVPPSITDIENNVFNLFLAFVPILFVLVGFQVYFYRKAKEEMMQQFAATLGYSYEKSAALNTVQGMLFSLGREQAIVDVLSGMYNGASLRIFTFVHTEGSGKSSHQEFESVLYFVLPITMPHIQFNSNVIGGTPIELFKKEDTEAVELEGGFDARFNLRVTKGMQMEIRELFQPNIMADIQSNYADFGFEANGNVLYFMHAQFPLQREQWLANVQCAQKFFDLLMPGLQEIAQKS